MSGVARGPPRQSLAFRRAGRWAIAAVLASAPALAQAPVPTQLLPQGSPIPRILPVQPPAVAPGPEPVPPPDTVPAPSQPLLVTSVAIDGATAFPPARFEQQTQSLVSSATPLASIEAVRQTILQQYRSEGYVLTTVSAMLDAAGRLRFVVVEGRIARVELDGDIGPAGTQVLRFLNRLTEEQPITSATLERYLLLAQDVPGIEIHAVLKPSTGEPGALDLVAQVSRKPVSGLLIFDNRAFYRNGPVESLAVIDLNSFTEVGEQTEFSYYHSFPDTQNFGQVASEWFVGGSGLRVRIFAGRGLAVPDGNTIAALQRLDDNDTTTVFGGSLSYPLIRSRQQTLNLVGGLDMLESQIDTMPTGTPYDSSDSLRVLRAGVDYVVSDLWFGSAHSAVNAASFRLSHGLHALGASSNDNPAAPRPNEQTDFTKISGEVSRTQTLFTLSDGASVALVGQLTGQWSGNILPPSEQFYLSGLSFARGYDAGQVPGDKALAATLELQFNKPTDLSVLGLAPEVTSQFYLFYDWGETWQNQPSDVATRITSTGGGVRLRITSSAEVDFEALERFSKYPNGSQGQAGALNGIGLYWRLLGRF